MNDHCGADGSSEERVSSFTNDMESSIEVLQENGIDVIIIFFNRI